MPVIQRHAPGSFCFVELASADQNRAKHFYEPLFGWSHHDSPLGPARVYTLFQIDGSIAAAAYTMGEQERAQVPPHWQVYIAVENADAAAGRVTELGGTVIKEPFDVMDQGRMAVVQDPTGAYFSMWQAANGIGIQIGGVPGTLCWADLNTREPDLAKQFYEKLFGWQMTMSEHGPYLHIKNGDDFIGGIPPANETNPYIPPHWLLYYQVDDVDASAAKVQELGGKLHLGPMTMEHVGRFAVAADAEGASFALFKSAS